MGMLTEAADAPQPLPASQPAANPAQRPASAGTRDDVVATPIDARPAALLNGAQIQWGQLRPALTEAAGAAVLEEFVLDTQTTRMLTARSLSIDSAAIERERRLLLETLDPDADVAARLLETLRDERGLGPVRFESLLRRNAGLRALVTDQVTVTGAAIDHLYDITYGNKRQCRLITVPSLQDAEATINRIKGGASFADLAVETSTDASAFRGGLLEPISRRDPAYPEALREALFTLSSDGVSGPILIDRQYAIIRLERDVPGTRPPREEVEEELARVIRLQQERVMMDDLARVMLDDASLTIYDSSLADTWRRRHRSR